MSEVRAGRLSRRQLMVGALSAGSGGALVAADPALADSTPVGTGPLLSAALAAEQATVLAYRRVIALPFVAPRVGALLRVMLGHNRDHAAVLASELRAMGSPLPVAPTTLSQANQTLSKHGMSGDLSSVHTLKDAVQVLLDFEAVCEGAYYAAIGGVTSTAALVRAAQALACDAQHSALLGEIEYEGNVQEAVPNWYVAGVS